MVALLRGRSAKAKHACSPTGKRLTAGGWISEGRCGYPYAEADEVVTGGAGSSLRRLSWTIHASASALDSKPSIVWRVPSLPAMLMLKVPSPLGTIEYLVMCYI